MMCLPGNAAHSRAALLISALVIAARRCRAIERAPERVGATTLDKTVELIIG
jgi:hypothetical protein